MNGTRRCRVEGRTGESTVDHADRVALVFGGGELEDNVAFLNIEKPKIEQAIHRRQGAAAVPQAPPDQSRPLFRLDRSCTDLWVAPSDDVAMFACTCVDFLHGSLSIR